MEVLEIKSRAVGFCGALGELYFLNVFLLVLFFSTSLFLLDDEVEDLDELGFLEHEGDEEEFEGEVVESI